MQAALRRSEQDVRRMNELGARVRLVKGAYKEPETVAYQRKDEVDAAFLRLMQLLLDGGTYPAIATHDPAMIDATRSLRASNAASRMTASSFRCCMESDATSRPHWQLTADRMRLYIPFGREWFPYFMRRLGERPANLGFVVRGILQER